jgi:hypothetical protein
MSSAMYGLDPSVGMKEMATVWMRPAGTIDESWLTRPERRENMIGLS